jgi:NDP-sugar pyrophosphorylase family protein
VLAGVHAWGESALEQVCPRPLLPVVGRPLTWYVLDWLARAGIRQASICANSDTRIFRQCLGNGTLNDMQLDYYADLMPRGPAGCVRDAATADADVLVVVEASVATRIDLAALLNAHRQARAALTIVVMGPDRTEPAGIYVLSRTALGYIPTRGYQDIKEMLIPKLYGRGEVVLPWPVDDRENLRVRDAASYLAVNSWALEGPSPAWVPPPGYRALAQAYVHESARVAGTARLIGPLVVGPHCRIDDGATIVGTTTLGAHCRIGADAVVSRTALWTGCHVEAGAIVDHCVLVHGATVEPAGMMRDTVCVPADATTLDIPQDYWALAPRQPATPNLLDRMLAAERIDGRLLAGAARRAASMAPDAPREEKTTTTRGR